MERVFIAALAISGTLTVVGLAGCNQTDGVTEPDAPPAATAEVELPPAVAAELAKLSESDRVLAMEQRICPVSEELLGSMGQPIKLTVEGREVFICCEGCAEDVRSDPAQHFEKLDSGA